jgi:hypothetical protein
MLPARTYWTLSVLVLLSGLVAEIVMVGAL